jgi:RNA polymerase sigma-70 factor (ECF subfamily)
MLEPPDDASLLTIASRGESDGFRQLFQRHYEAVFCFAYRLSGSTPVAEEITQDCFLSLLQHPVRYNSARGSLKTYIYGIARNLFLKHLRRNGMDVNLEDSGAAARPDEGPDPAELALRDELGEAVRKAVAMLPPLQREALVLFEYEGLTLVDIAHIVGAEVMAVKSRLARARDNLRLSLTPYLCHKLKTSERRSQKNAADQ